MFLNSLPEPSIVNDLAAYEEMLEHLSVQNSIAIDTESNSLHAYRERICLIQLSSPERDFLVDPFVFSEFNTLGQILADPKVQKVFHAGDYDLACLKRDYGFEIHNLFDTMLAATALAEPNLGLAALLEKYLGVTVDKKYQRADWGQRPLLPEMLQYGQSDSHYLLALRDALKPILEKEDRLTIVLEDSEALANLTLPMKNHEENLWKVKGVGDLKPKALSLLHALNHMREELAEKLDKPPFKILGDRALIEIAQTQPKYIQELSLLPSLSPGQVRRFGAQLMHAISEWRKNPTPVQKHHNGRMDDALINRKEALSNWRKIKGQENGLPSNVILPRDMLEKIAAARIDSLQDLQAMMQHSPSRFTRFGDEILDVLKRKTP